MASPHTDPKNFVVHIRGRLLSKYLKECHDLDFQVGEEDEGKTERAERFMQFMLKECTKEQRARVFTQMDTINDLSSPRQIDGLCKFAGWIDSDLLFKTDGKKNNNDEKALLAFMRYPDDFEKYHTQAWLEEKTLREFSLPTAVPPSEIATEEKLVSFQTRIKEFYKKEYMGEQCEAQLFTDGDRFVLRVYVEDQEREEKVFKNGKIVGQSIAPLIDVVFIYKQELSMLGVYAESGKDDERLLAKMFGTHFLGIDIDTNPIRYKIASTQDIMKMNLAAPNAAYGIDRIYLKSIRLKHNEIPHRIFIDVAGTHNTGTSVAQSILEELHLDTNTGWHPYSMALTVVFKQSGPGRRKQVPVIVAPPNTCTLKNREQDDIVRKLLRDLGIYVA